MDKSLYIYYDHKFSCFQVVRPSKYFNGNFRELAECIAGVDPKSPTGFKFYRWVVK